MCSTSLSWAQSDNIESLEKRLDLKKISDTPFDIDLRIYLNRGLTNVGQVLWIRKKDEEWIGTKYDYYLKIEKNGETGKIKKINSESLIPKESWEELWCSLEDSNIRNLPSQQEIKNKLRKEVTTRRGKGYEIITLMDGSRYTLTMKKAEDVIVYEFHSPWVYSEKFPEVEEVKNYSEIISKLEEQLRIKFRN